MEIWKNGNIEIWKGLCHKDCCLNSFNSFNFLIS